MWVISLKFVDREKLEDRENIPYIFVYKICHLNERERKVLMEGIENIAMNIAIRKFENFLITRNDLQWSRKKSTFKSGRIITFTLTCYQQYDFRFGEKIHSKCIRGRVTNKIIQFGIRSPSNNAMSSSLSNVPERKLDSLLFYQEQQSGVDALHLRIGLDKFD